MNNLLLIAGAACSALVFIDVTGAPHLIKRLIWGNRGHARRLKPFDCPPCLSFWIGTISAFFLGKNWPEVLCIGVIASILAVLIKKMLDK